MYGLLLFLTLTHAAIVSPPKPQRYETVTFSFKGPSTSETATPNPFLDYRLDLILTHKTSLTIYSIPGYYAADGNAAETSASEGNIWHVKFTPPRTGSWHYVASFRQGANTAVQRTGGERVAFDGDKGEFVVKENRMEKPDLRAKGKLEYVGQRYLKFANGETFVKLGTNTPESLLAYGGFDGYDGPEEMKLGFETHGRDFREGDPSWQGRGREIIGAVNYLGKQGVNCLFAMLMTVKGDSGGAVHPWIGGGERLRFDVSKLAQWGIVFEHAREKGMALNLALMETENEALFEFEEGVSREDGFARSRKVYYREVVARFGHLLGVMITLSEENGWNEQGKHGGGFEWGTGNSVVQREMFSEYIRELDGYNAPILVHTYPSLKLEVYQPMLGGVANVEGASLQMGKKISTYRETKEWVDKSVKSGYPWVVTADEIGADAPGEVAGVPLDEGLAEAFRGRFVWGNFMAGGGGVEVFSGSVDQSLDDFRRLEHAWKVFKRPVDLVELGVPVWAMEEVAVVKEGGGVAYARGKEGDVYVVYRGGDVRVGLNLTDVGGSLLLRWFDPKANGELLLGDDVMVRGGDVAWLDGAPGEGDWVAVVSRQPVRKRWRSGVSPHLLIPGSVTMGLGNSRWGSSLATTRAD